MYFVIKVIAQLEIKVLCGVIFIKSSFVFSSLFISCFQCCTTFKSVFCNPMIYTHTAVGIYVCPWFSRLTVSFLIYPCVENMGPKILITSKCREFIGAILIVIKVCIYVFILLKNEISDIHIFWKENCRTFVWKPPCYCFVLIFFYRKGPFCFAFKFVCLRQSVKSVKS